MVFLSALVPVIAIVALGRFMASNNIPNPEGWRAIERVCYQVLFPALIIKVLANAPFEQAPWRMALALFCTQLIMALIGQSARYWPGMKGPAVGSIIQSNVRWNTFVALSLSGVLFGEAGLALTAVAAATMIPTANVISVLGFSRYGEHQNRRNPLLDLFKNPLVIACIIGGLINVAPFALPDTVNSVLNTLGSAAVALGLLSAGAGVDPQALKRSRLTTLFWSLVRVVAMPVIALSFGLWLKVDAMALAIIAIASATPTATNGYILARQMGGDAPLMANMIAAQTLLSAITMPLVIWAFDII